MCNHTCSALTQWVTLIEGKKINVHKASQAKVSGQLPFLGSRVCLTVSLFATGTAHTRNWRAHLDSCSLFAGRT